MADDEADTEKKPKAEPDFNTNVFNETMRLWVEPEIVKRQGAGLLSKPFAMHAAQVLFADTGNPIVRLNEEVKAVLRTRPKEGVALGVGGPVKMSDIAMIENTDLIDEDKDHGHITLIVHEGTVYLTFNTRRNRKRSDKLLDLAEGFARTAKYAARQRLLGPYIDNLFAAFELAFRADLMTLFGMKGKTHRHVKQQVNAQGHIGNIEKSVVALYNRLGTLREAARYTAEPINNVDLTGHKIVMAEIKRLRERNKR